jgi:NAD(P)-dependent dehydrogenase (short-subunit alcohol dehydrogenase family)
MQNGKWTMDSVPSQEGRVFVITGGNSGIGYEAAKALAAKAAYVVLAVRDLAKGARARDEILIQYPHATVKAMLLDLANLTSIRQFAQEFQYKFDWLDVLINNAGVMALPRRLTADGFEMQFGTNHLGHFALTGLLIDSLLATPASRVVTVSSMMHMRGKIRFDDLMGEKSYDKQAAYSQSKLANLLFAFELQRKLAVMPADTISLAAHPGYAATNLQYAGPEMEDSKASKKLMQLANALFAQSAEMGALPVLYAALSADMSGGEYAGPSGMMGARGYPVKSQSSPASHDLEAAARLWQVSKELTGVDYAVLEGEFVGAEHLPVT